MEGYKPPKMFAELPRKIQEKHDSGEWLNVEVPTHQDISSSDTRSKDRTKGKSGIRESKRNKREIRSGFSPGDEFFLDQASFTRGEAPDFVVKSVGSDGSIRYFEKGSRVVSVVSQDDFAKMVGVADGAKYDEIGGAKDRKIFTLYGDGLLNDLDSVEASEISGEGYTDDQNWLLWADFMMRRNRLQELVQSYHKQAEERGDTSLVLREIVQFAKSIPEEFLSDEQREKMARFVSHEPVDKGDRDKRAQKPRQKKMRLDDEPERKSPTKKSAPKRGRVQKSERAVTNDTQAPVVENVVAPEFTENVIENSVEQLESYQNSLEEEVRNRGAFIEAAHDRESLESIFSYEVNPMTGGQTKNKIFLSVPDEAQQAFDSMGESLQREARSLWNERNSDLEALYLGKKFTFALDFVKAEWRKRFVEAKDLGELDTLGTGQNGTRRFIPTDPKNDSIEFGPVREVLQEMIVHRRSLPSDTTLPGFSKLFGDQLKPLIASANKELADSWNRRRGEFGTEMVPLSPQESRVSRKIALFFDEARPIIEQNFASAGGLQQALSQDPDGVYEYLRGIKTIVDDLVSGELRSVGLSAGESHEHAVARVAEDAWFNFLSRSTGFLLEDKRDK
ncbi:MAG: hypothetical protein WAU28_05615 [Candidatus Moraniibacteriota bacterium]